MSYERLDFPLERSALVTAFDAVEKDAERLLAPLDDDAFNRPPAAGGWSAAQCLDHLAVTTRVYLEAMERGLGRARRPGGAGADAIRPGAPSRWFIRSLEPPARRRFKAPAAIVPAPGATREAGWREFVSANDAFRAFAHRCAPLDVNRSRFPNPFIPGVRFSLGTGLAVILAHHRRHVVQIESVLAGGGVPAAQ